MGLAKLNIWFRDEHCRPFPNLKTVPGFDWVEIRDCAGKVIRHLDVPIGDEAHVEVEVPPGCYVVQGHVCGESVPVNDYTDKDIVMVGCNQEVCVNLIVPSPKTCARRDLHAFVREARVVGVPEVDIRTTARTILAAARVSPEEMVVEVERIGDLIKNIKEAKNVLREYHATIDILKGIHLKSD